MRKICLSLLVCNLLFLVGCWDYNEMNMQEIVLVAAVDRADDGINLTVRCAPRGEDEKSMIYTSSGESFYTAVRELSERTDKKMYWGHISTILIGEEALPLVDTVFDTLLRAEDVYLDIVPIAVFGDSARAFASEESDLLLTFANEENSKRRRALKLQELLRERDEFHACVLPRLSKDSLGLRLAGGVVLGDGGKTINLTDEEMLFLDLLTRDGEGGYLPTVVTKKGAEVSFEILGNTRKKEMRDGEEVLTVRLVLSPGEIRGDADLSEVSVATERYLEGKFSDLVSSLKRNGFSALLGESADMQIQTKVKISNATGET